MWVFSLCPPVAKNLTDLTTKTCRVYTACEQYESTMANRNCKSLQCYVILTSVKVNLLTAYMSYSVYCCLIRDFIRVIFSNVSYFFL